MSIRTPEDTVRAFYDVFNDAEPQRFDDVISAAYIDYGHTPAGHGPDGARADYFAALSNYGYIKYTIEALISSGQHVSALWTGALEDGTRFQGLSLYRVADGKILETTNAAIGDLPTPRTS